MLTLPELSSRQNTATDIFWTEHLKDIYTECIWSNENMENIMRFMSKYYPVIQEGTSKAT